jgi:phosphatidate cytidylyltransferase
VITPDQGKARADGAVSSGGDGARNLVLRVASAAVLAPIAVIGAYVGGWLFLALCAIAAAAILWEWTGLVSGGSDPRILVPGLAALLIALALAGMNRPGGAAAIIVVGAVVVASLAARETPGPPVSRNAGSHVTWAAAGVIYAGSAFLGPALLRRDPELGLVAMLFLAATVWITDIFAYFVGSAVGGPRLCPQISPKKTWSGAIGGLAGGVAAGTLVAYASGVGRPAVAGVIGLLLSILAQAGDLFESAVKRHFDAKDASRLIPGHGGVMDRLDGFLVAALAALLIGILRQGTDAPARGLLVW